MLNLKEIKKESRQKLSHNNLIKSALILILRAATNLHLLSTAALCIYSASELTLPVYSPLAAILSPVTAARSMNQPLLAGMLFAIFAISFLVFTPLHIGTYRWFDTISNSTHNKPSLRVAFCYYASLKSIAMAAVFRLALIAKGLFTIIISIIPWASIFTFACLQALRQGPAHQALPRVIIILSAAAIAISGLLSARSLAFLVPAKFIFVAQDHPKILYSIKSAGHLARTNSNTLVRFFISFPISIALGLLVIPIPIIVPYIYLCASNLTQKLIYNQTQGLDAIPLTERVIDINSRSLGL